MNIRNYSFVRNRKTIFYFINKTQKKTTQQQNQNQNRPKGNFKNSFHFFKTGVDKKKSINYNKSKNKNNIVYKKDNIFY